MIRQRLTSLIIAAACLMPSLAAHAGPERLVADLSNDQVAITSSYHGTELLLFGAFEGQDNDDVVLVVSGPPTKVAQRRSDKVAGIWVNVETNTWQNSRWPRLHHPTFSPKRSLARRHCRLNMSHKPKMRILAMAMVAVMPATQPALQKPQRQQ